MAPGFFWCRVSSIGVTAEEQEALDRGEALPPERRADLDVRLEAARVILLNAPPRVPYLK